MLRKYLLVDDVPVDCTDDEYWNWKESIPKVDQTALGMKLFRDVIEGSIISTVFLGEATEYSPNGNPLVFETYVCGGPLATEMRQSTTMQSAKHIHNNMINKVVEKIMEMAGEIEEIEEIDTEVIDESEISVILGED